MFLALEGAHAKFKVWVYFDRQAAEDLDSLYINVYTLGLRLGSMS